MQEQGQPQVDVAAEAGPDVAVDVAVIGGGPAGATVAALLARRGRSVVMFEKDRHPRFHIGESLLPLNLPILERLGVLRQVEAIGVVKRGADFPVEAGRYHTFRFARSLSPVDDHAYQVLREDFDRILFRHAADCGADTREATTVTGLRFAEASVQVAYTGPDGAGELSARYLVDASGRDTFLGNRQRLKRRSRRHQSAAIYGHFRGVSRRPGEDAGNISVYRFEHGWMWMIPLPDDVMSVGVVCEPAYLKQRRVPPGRFLLDTVALMPDAAQRMEAAEPLGPTRASGNYSYQCTRIAGPRWVMVGDAYAFVDPIFSSGVLLAMSGAEHAAALVDTVLREPARERRLQRAYARRVQRGLDLFSWFIHRFTSPVMAALFRDPRNPLGVEEAMVSMLAGDVYDSPAVLRRLHVFRALYRIGCALWPRRSLAWWRERRRQLRQAHRDDGAAREPA